jgi:two-component system OmpR family sensor kinase
LAGVLALAGVFVYLWLGSELSGSLDGNLRSRADDVAALVRESDRGLADFRGRLVETEESFAQVLTPSGRVVDASASVGSSPVLDRSELARARDGPVFLDERRVPGIEGTARLLARPVEGPGTPLVVVVGATTEDREEALAGLVRAFALGAPVALLLASGVGYLLASSALRPVEAMRRRAERITLEGPEERLPLPPSEDEIRRLGETLNAMLARLEAALDRERTFVADASHELRSPLAILRTELELALRSARSPEELRAALRSAGEEADRLSQLAEDLLVIARSDRGRLPVAREDVAVCDLLESARERFAARAGEAGRTIELDAPQGLRARLDPLRVQQAVGNLIDNSLRHGRGTIRVAARPADSSVELEVRDEGPGFPPGFAGQAFERFTRADRGRSGGGAGLGLSIVLAIARAHGGDAQAGRSKEGGAKVTLTLPVNSVRSVGTAP